MQYKKDNASVRGDAEISEPRNISFDPDQFADDETIIQPMALKLISTESSTFDPYNTCRFEMTDLDAADIDTSKSWDLHSRYKRTF